MRSEDVIAREEARRSEPPEEYGPVATDWGNGAEIYEGDEVMDLGQGRLVLTEPANLQEALQKALGLKRIEIYILDLTPEPEGL